VYHQSLCRKATGQPFENSKNDVLGGRPRRKREPRTDSSVLRAVSHQQHNVNRRFPMAAGMNGYTDYVDGGFLQSPTNPFGRVSIAKKCLMHEPHVQYCSFEITTTDDCG
jgi:hypothetical protein